MCCVASGNVSEETPFDIRPKILRGFSNFEFEYWQKKKNFRGGALPFHSTAGGNREPAQQSILSVNQSCTTVRKVSREETYNGSAAEQVSDSGAGSKE